MRCLPYVHFAHRYSLVGRQICFPLHFDQQDFMYRQVASVVDAYLEEWFHDGPAGTRYFKIPPVSVINGKTQFISGRHRTAVLLRHLECIPLSFHMRKISDADTDWIRRIALSPIETDTLFALPDLPIRPHLP